MDKKDFSTFPEGYEEVKAQLDFLPDDKAKDNFMYSMMIQLISL